MCDGYAVVGSGEVQNTLNQKVSLKFSKIVNFVLRFIILIKFKFKIYIFNNHYESRCKINNFKRLWTSPLPCGWLESGD
jgi:hypothetical protein